MYSLIEYYEQNDKVKHHLVEYCNKKSEIEEAKIRIAKQLNEAGIETLEVIASRNINSLKEILKNENLKIFQVVKD